MFNKNNLTKYKISELKVFREHLLEATSTEEILIAIDEMIQEKEEASSKSLNARFPIDWMNIDLDYRQLLHSNGIETEQQLLDIQDLWSLKGMTQGGYEQISWAREFFDMRPIEELPEEKRSPMNVAKVIVKQAKKNNTSNHK